MEPESPRRVLNVVGMNKASASSRLPESTVESAAASSRSCSEAETPPVQPETPRANELSTECSEPVPKYAESMREASDVGVRLGCSERPVVAVEANRRSVERLAEAEEVSGELARPALVDGERSCGYAERRPASPTVSKTEPRAGLHSLIPLEALTPSACLPSFIPQANPFNQPSLELGRSVLKSPYNGSFQRHPCNTVSASFISAMTPRSPEYEMGLSPVSKPDYTWADPVSRPSSLELVWWERTKPPNTAACRWFLYETVNTLSKRVGSATYPGRPLTPSNVTPPLSLMFFVSAALALRYLLWMPCGVHLLIAVLGQRI